MTGTDHPVVAIEEPGRTPLHLVLREPLEVGRDCAGVLLDDPGVSRRHVLLSPRDGEVVITDLGSTNGTSIDDRPLDAPAVLTGDSVARLGDTTIALAGTVTGPLLADRLQADAALPVTSIDRMAAEVAAERPPPPPAALRDGTVTIVFTDIESSTSLAESFGDRRWFEVLATHNTLVRRRVSAFGGSEIKSQGDGFMLAFPSAKRALDCMISVQRDMAALRSSQHPDAVAIRVGAHTGEAILDDTGDLFGLHVNIAARVAAQAAGGEILVSSIVREIVGTYGDFRFGVPRRADLKGLTGAFALHPLLWEEVPTGRKGGQAERNHNCPAEPLRP